MILGMPTLIETKSLENGASLCNELGLNFIELNMNLPQYQLDKIDVEKFNTIAQKYNIFYTIHLDENLNISDFNPYIAFAYIQTVKETIELAKQLNVPIINMHLSKGVYFTLPDKKVYLFDEYKEQYLQSVRNFCKECEIAIGDFPIKICIENCDGYTDFNKDAIDILLNSSVFGLTFDVGHNHGVGGTDEPIIVANKNKLHHMHLHDAKGRQNHMALGTGELDIQKYLDLASECNCRIVLETKTIAGLKQSVNLLKDNCTELNL